MENENLEEEKDVENLEELEEEEEEEEEKEDLQKDLDLGNICESDKREKIKFNKIEKDYLDS